MNETDVRNRINEAMQSRGLNPRSISGNDANLYAKSYLQITKGKTMTLPIILSLLNAIPDLSAEWLFRGVGLPFLSNKEDNSNKNNKSEPIAKTPQQSREEPYATAQGDGAVAIAGDNNVTIPKQVLDMLAEKDRQLAAKDEIIKQYIMRK